MALAGARQPGSQAARAADTETGLRPRLETGDRTVPGGDLRSQHNTQTTSHSRNMADSEMSPKAKVTYDQNKFEVDLNVAEYLPEVIRLSVIVISEVFLDFILSVMSVCTILR